jgi:hypothetical protein
MNEHNQLRTNGNLVGVSNVMEIKMIAQRRTPTPPKRAELEIPRLPGLEDLDRPELDEDGFGDEEPDTLRSPLPDWADESGVKQVGLGVLERAV